MSLDFTAYFATKPKQLPVTSQGESWILQVEGPMRLEQDDVPLGIQALIGRCRWQVELHLEGAVSDAAERALKATIADLASVSLGVVDEQREVLIDQQGERPVPNIEEPEDHCTGYALQVFFEQANEFTRDDMDRVLQVIEAEMPEALPHRYGQWEPLQHRWDEGGRAAFLKTWERQDPPFWKGKTPVSAGHCTFDYRVQNYGFRSGHFDIDLRPTLMANPAKLLAALGLGEQLAVATDAFYTALIPSDWSQGPFWRGIAPTEHLLLVLGEPLLSRWPEFGDIGRPVGDRHFAASGLSGAARINPPARLCCPVPEMSVPGRAKFMSPNDRYAPDFPFPKTDPYQPQQ